MKKKILEVQTFVNYNIPYVLLCPCLLHLHCDLNAEKSDTKRVLILEGVLMMLRSQMQSNVSARSSGSFTLPTIAVI